MNEMRKLMEAVDDLFGDSEVAYNAGYKAKLNGGETAFMAYKQWCSWRPGYASEENAKEFVRGFNDGGQITDGTPVEEEIKQGLPGGRPFIDLSGPDGNAFVIMGRAKQYAKDLGLDGEAIVAEMQASDYENLLNVFDKYFGDYVDLYRGDSD